MIGITNCSASQDSGGFMQGTQARDGGTITINGLTKPPKSVYVWGIESPIGVSAYATNLVNNNYTFTNAMFYSTTGGGTITSEVSYSDGTLIIDISTALLRYSVFSYALTY